MEYKKKKLLIFVLVVVFCIPFVFSSSYDDCSIYGTCQSKNITNQNNITNNYNVTNYSTGGVTPAMLQGNLSLYYLLNNPYSYYNSTTFSYTEVDPKWSDNFTLYNSTWTSTYNSTYDVYNSTGLIRNWNVTELIINWNITELIRDWNATEYIKDWNSTGLIINWSGGISTEVDPLWSGNYTSVYNESKWSENFTLYNSSWSSTFNSTYHSKPSGKGVNFYVAYWNGTNNITGDSRLIYNYESETLGFIGTTTASFKVGSNQAPASFVELFGNGTGSSLHIYDSVANRIVQLGSIFGNINYITSTSNNLKFGINTINPLGTFDVNTPSGTHLTNSILVNSTTGMVHIGNLSLANDISQGALVIQSPLSDPSVIPLYFNKQVIATQFGQSAFIGKVTSTGDMVDGFGPQMKWYIEDNASVVNTIAQLRFLRDGADNEGRITFRAGTNGNDEFLTIRSSGNIGINQQSPSSTLDIVGTLEVSSLSGTYGSGSAYVCVYNNGTLWASDSACP